MFTSLSNNWIVAMLVSTFLWSAYAIPQKVAADIHGVPVNLLFETAAFILITFLLWEKIGADIGKLTTTSGFYATLMALGSAFGFYYFLQAVDLAPANSLPLVFLCAGLSFPLQGALFALIGTFSGDASSALSLRQWLAIVGMITCVVIYSWKS